MKCEPVSSGKRANLVAAVELKVLKAAPAQHFDRNAVSYI